MAAGPPFISREPTFSRARPAEAHDRDLLLDHALDQQGAAVGGPGDALARAADPKLRRLGELRAVAGPHLQQAVAVEERRLKGRLAATLALSRGRSGPASQPRLAR
jgi:hypothetical protein